MRRPVAATDLVGIDIEMEENLARRRHSVALGGDLTQLAADDQEAIGTLDQIVGDPGIASEDAGGHRMGAGDRPLAGKRVRYRNLLGLGQRLQRFGGALTDVPRHLPR